LETAPFASRTCSIPRRGGPCATVSSMRVSRIPEAPRGHVDKLVGKPRPDHPDPSFSVLRPRARHRAWYHEALMKQMLEIKARSALHQRGWRYLPSREGEFASAPAGGGLTNVCLAYPWCRPRVCRDKGGDDTTRRWANDGRDRTGSRRSRKRLDLTTNPEVRRGALHIYHEDSSRRWWTRRRKRSRAKDVADRPLPVVLAAGPRSLGFAQRFARALEAKKP
jgi:hypothetical protein